MAVTVNFIVAVLVALSSSTIGVAAFECASGETVPDAYVNDDYCDCGSDEPLTSACAGWEGASFWCANEGHRALSVPASRVNDGICDCCDCTDEPPRTRGKNKCAEVAKAEAEAAAEQKAALQRGYETRLKLPAKGAKKRKKLQKRLKKKRERLERLTAELKEKKRKRKIARRAARQAALNATAEEFDWAKTGDDGTVSAEDNNNNNNTVEAAELAYNATRDRKRQVKAQLDTLRGLLLLDFGRDLEFFPIQGKCYTLLQQGYIYTFCPFDKILQGKVGEADVVLGKWKDWKPKYTAQSYTAGDKCWQGPERSCNVRLRCGAHNKLVRIDEPEKCSYEAVFEAPAACSKNPYKQAVPTVKPRKILYDHPHARH